MFSCPRCQQLIDDQAIKCPYCQASVKAFGHPGIPLYQVTGTDFLCDRCLYHEDNTCNFPQRPYAQNCTLFQDKSQALEETFNPNTYNNIGLRKYRVWLRKNQALLLVVILIVISVIIALK